MPQTSKNISGRTYHHIRESLLSSGMYVGQKIPHVALGQKLGISHTPLREALFRLAAEGLIAHQNNRGFFVEEMSWEEAREIYEAREVIEPFLVIKAAEIVTKQEIVGLEKILKQYEKHINEPYTRRRLLADKQFHLGIAMLAKNNTLIQTLTLYYDKLIMKRPIQHLSMGRGEEAFKEHMKIIDALKKRDGEAAGIMMKAHVRQQCAFVLDDIRSRQESESMIEIAPL